ncbi:Os07g0658100 [Oryza sativa Japonica Group]|uniref:Os07g0658100 protein n=1 Tax=Oryza sativa subsp. japonica TaxID=39947 RepID=Q0D3Z2_ORYSJ|nr:Os07g0658100 [Oryza sativa Japonica Group]|eukprot:NP_001060517.2 Os07g0658100 [Oryza sativa Japonica Group]
MFFEFTSKRCNHVSIFFRWPYPFLDLSSSGAPLWYLAMAIVHIPCFFLYWSIVKAKQTYFPRLFPHAYVRN